jgi:hypothetical protein
MALIARHPSRVPAILATMAGGSRPEAPQRGLAYKCKERHIACILHDWPAPLHVLPGLAQLGLINLGRQAYGQTDSFMASTDDRQAGTWSVSSSLSMHLSGPVVSALVMDTGPLETDPTPALRN